MAKPGVNEKLKFCPQCKISKPLNLFAKNRHKKSGLCVYCKDCCHSNCKKYYFNNIEKVTNAQREYYILILGACIGLIIGAVIFCWHYKIEFYEDDKSFQGNKAFLQNYNAVEREKIWNDQKELTDYADKQRESYKKTHNGY